MMPGTPYNRFRRVREGVSGFCGRLGAWSLGLGLGLLGLGLESGQGAEADKVQPIAIRPLDPADAAKISYVRDIKPLMAAYCVECHGTTEPEGDYQVGSVADLLKSGKKNGPGIIPGKPDESSVVRYIRGELKPQMPKGSPPVPGDALHQLRQWILAGAKDDSATYQAVSDTAAWEQFDPRTATTVAKARLSSETMEALLGGTGEGEKRFLARRQWRMTQLPAAPVPPAVASPVFNAVDKFVAAKWDPKAPSPAVCSDEAFLRRAYLDIIGVVPTALEVHRFLSDTAKDRRDRLVDALLARDEEYANHWTTFWEDIIASSNGSIRGGILTRGNYRVWIYNSLQKNRPYDLMVAELIDTTLPGARKAAEQRSFEQTFKVAYVRNDSPVITMETAANIGQVFMGTSMKCASCHSHFENAEWPQSRFLAFASMFAEKDLELVRCEKKTGAYIAPAFPFEIPSAPRQLPLALEERLSRAAQLLTDPLNPRFAHAFVNRLWKRCFGLGLVEPVDDFRADRRASHPELMEWLAQEFMRSGYDVKHVLRLIIKSRTYQLAYEPKLADVFDPTRPDATRLFRSPQLRRMSAEQLLDSTSVVGTQQTHSARRTLFRKNATTLTQALGRPADRTEVITTRSEEMAVLQFLEFLNGEEYQSYVYRAPLLDLLAVEDDAAVTVESLYLAALGRQPSPAETAAFSRWLQPALQSSKGTPPPREELVLFDDDVPGIFPELSTTNYVKWVWGKKPDQPVFSGQMSTRTAGKERPEWQGVAFPPDLALVNVNESFFAQVYLDPKDPPEAVWVRIQQDHLDHQAVWSSTPVNRISDPLLVMTYAGELPATGGWVRVEIPFKKMQLLNGPIASIAFGVSGGTAYWDGIGLTRSGRSPRVQALGDILWALETGPEFQFIR